MSTSDLTLYGAMAGLIAIALWYFSPPADPASSDPEDQAAPEVPTTILETMQQPFTGLLGLWHPPAQYAGLITNAERRYGLPADLLARLLYQESRYREDIITGATRSPVGALGIAQFMPATAADMNLDPLNPAQAIDGAGRYLAQLFRKFGNWSEALAAYNWGMGNVDRKGLEKAPTETQNYYTQILRDVNASNNTQLA